MNDTAFKWVMLILVSPVIVTLMIISYLNHQDGNWPEALAYLLMMIIFLTGILFLPTGKETVDQTTLSPRERFFLRLRTAAYNMLPISLVFGVMTANMDKPMWDSLPIMVMSASKIILIATVLELVRVYVWEAFQRRRLRKN